MKIFIFLENDMLKKCFSEADLGRLSTDHELVLPGTRNIEQLSESWHEHCKTTDALITGWGTPPITQEQLNEAPQLKVIAHAAGSVKYLMPSNVWERDIRVTTAREALAIGVAETTLAMMIAGLKGLFPAHALTSDGGWKSGDTNTPGFTVREMYDINIGVIGASMVGRHVLRLLEHFEVSAFLCDPYISADEADRMGAKKVELDELIRDCDIVSLHAPALPQTRHMLSTQQFQSMRDDAIFINTARGMLVDEDAMCKELATGRISAFIDVTDPEPPQPDHPMRSMPNVVLTPHLAGALSNGCKRLGRSVVDQLIEFSQGQTMEGEITESQFAQLA